MLEFSIDLRKLSEETASPFGNLDSLKLDISDNLLSVLPENATLRSKTGIPIYIWTETFVRGDENKTFGKAKSSETSGLVWIPCRYFMRQRSQVMMNT